tara:strand:- start:373 stop:1575 length:1203 start_codon:yes stop_codon:yes gene_type:complete
MVFLYNKDIEQSITYEALIEDVNNFSSIDNIIDVKDPVKFFIKLLANICHNIDCVILDNDISKEDKERYKKDFSLNAKPTLIKINNFEDLLSSITYSKSKISIFTSGTTGEPKKVDHNVDKFIKMSRIADKYKNDVWAFLYNPTHMAGLQVFFQALLNKNSLIYLFQTSRIEFMNACEKHSITNISATPTFYRLLAPFDFQLNTIRKCTLGGEKSDMNLIKKLKAVFPNSNIYNIYASTEAGSIFISNKGDVFKVLDTLKDKVRFDNNEIIIHKSLLGNFYKEEWFSTGDIVEFTNEDKTEFRIASRKSDIVNIGGNRIDLLEVESEIYKVKGVKSTLVYAVDNSVLGKIITAEIVSSITYSKKEFKEELKKKLQLYKIPTMIKIVEELQVTRTGKLKRN